MTKEQIIEILEKHQIPVEENYYDAVPNGKYDEVATEVLALFEKSDAKNSLQQEMLDGYNQEPIPGVTE